MKTALASSWRVLEQVSRALQPPHGPVSHASRLQPPPPSLREILEAYKARGDGDREMLLAMLNAKSSEDQVSPHAVRSVPVHKY